MSTPNDHTQASEKAQQWDPNEVVHNIDCDCTSCGGPARDQAVQVGFRYRDGEVLSPEREALSEDVELPEAVIDLGDGEWLTHAELCDMHAEQPEARDAE